MTALAGLPQVPTSALPATVRAGTAEQQETYRAALGFERVLLGQLVETMAEGSLGDGPQGEAVESALADALTSGGGLGLAAHIYASIGAGEHAATALGGDAA